MKNSTIKITGSAVMRGIDIRSRTIIFEYYNNNTIVNSGFNAMAHAISSIVAPSGTSEWMITKFDAGDSDVATQLNFTSLQGSNLYSSWLFANSLSNSFLQLTNIRYPAGTNSVEMDYYIPGSHFNGIEIKEMALFTQNGTMVNRILWPKVIKESTIAITGNFTLKFN